jgi:hypothetical protein
MDFYKSGMPFKLYKTRLATFIFKPSAGWSDFLLFKFKFNNLFWFFYISPTIKFTVLSTTRSTVLSTLCRAAFKFVGSKDELQSCLQWDSMFDFQELLASVEATIFLLPCKYLFFKQEVEIIFLNFSCKYRVLVSTLRDADRWPWHRVRSRQGESKALPTLPHFKLFATNLGQWSFFSGFKFENNFLQHKGRKNFFKGSVQRDGSGLQWFHLVDLY